MSRDDPGAPRPTKRWLPRWLKFLLMLLGFLFLVAALLWVIADVSTRDALEAELAKLRAQGWPTELEDLYPEPITDAGNAALVYGEAFAKLQMSDDELVLLGNITEEGFRPVKTDEAREQLRACLDNNADVLVLLHRAAQMKQCQFHIDYRWWTGTGVLTHPTPLRRCAWLSSAAAIAALAGGRGEAASQYWLDSVAVVRHQEGQKLIVPELARLSCLAICLQALETLIQSGGLTESQVAAALAALEGIEAPQSFAARLQGYLAFVREVPALPPDQTAALLGSSQTLFSAYCSPLARPWRQHDQATLLRLIREDAELTFEPYYKVCQKVDQWEKEATLLWENGLSSLRAPVTSALLLASASDQRHFAWLKARLATAQAALALELYRLRHGDYPETLDSVVPSLLAQVPVDPFDGQPLRYVNDGARVVVYSVGLDLTDDGGSDETGREGFPLDIVFTLQPRRRAKQTDDGA